MELVLVTFINLALFESRITWILLSADDPLIEEYSFIFSNWLILVRVKVDLEATVRIEGMHVVSQWLHPPSGKKLQAA